MCVEKERGMKKVKRKSGRVEIKGKKRKKKKKVCKKKSVERVKKERVGVKERGKKGV